MSLRRKFLAKRQQDEAVTREEEDDDEDLIEAATPPRQYVDNVTPLISSVFTSLAAVGWLYAWVFQKELWVLVFAVVDAFIMGAKYLVAKHLYTKMERDDLDSLIVMQIFRFLHTTAMFIIMKILTDILTFLILTSTMYWYNYIDVLFLFVFFSFIILRTLS